MQYKKVLSVALSFVLIFSFSSCKKNTAQKEEISIAVFVPGIVSGSPVYEMLVAGVTRAVTEAQNANQKSAPTITIVEAGTQQAEWGTKLTSLAASKKHSLIVSSNPALPEIIEPIAKQFPAQAFLILDSYFEGIPSLTTFQYNQREQGYLSGYMAALVSSSSMEYANSAKKIGLIAGQEYPAMLDIILPAYREGAKAVDPRFEVDFRIVGNWFDAAKGAELARAMSDAGVDVIMPICGGANQGVLAAAQEKNFYIAWFDDNGYSKAPGYVIASSVMEQERLAYEKTKAWLEGSLKSGVAGTVGLDGGYIDFVLDDPIFIQHVPEPLREKQTTLVQKLKNGELSLPVR